MRWRRLINFFQPNLLKKVVSFKIRSNDNEEKIEAGFTIVEVSIVLPAYNEVDRIESTVERTAAALREITTSFEIIIAEDGSIDGTERISHTLAQKYDFLIHLHSDERQGRGRALKRAFLTSKGDILVYIDVDLATDMKHLKELIQYIRDDYDFATGSRMLRESNVKRPFKRDLQAKDSIF